MKQNLKRPFLAIKLVLSNPRYFWIFIFVSILFTIVIYTSINWSFYGPLIRFNTILPIIFMILKETFLNIFKDFNGFMTVILSLLQGLAITMLIYDIRKFKNVNKTTTASSVLVTAGAVAGLGCVSCGTSLLIPVIALVFSSTSVALVNFASSFVLILAMLLCIYSIYSIGNKIQIKNFTKSMSSKTLAKEDKNEN